MAKKKVITIDPYADPRTAAMNADWIKIARKNRLKREGKDDTGVVKKYKSFAGATNITPKSGAGSGKVRGSAKNKTHTTAGISPYHESKKLTIDEVDEKDKALPP